MPLTRLATVDQACQWLNERGVKALSTDSRRVGRGDAFIAWPGYAQDGRQYVPSALKSGAAACLVESEGIDLFDFGNEDARVAQMDGLKGATGFIADAWFGQPSKRLDVIAVTGTNGKTSTAWWTAQALSTLGRRCGVIGTLGIGEPPVGGESESMVSTGLTTPDPVQLHEALRNFADDGFAACGIEASSIGIVEQRLAGAHIAVAIFTNFTRDHLDYHGTMTAYWRAKEQLFERPELRAAVINIDDPQGAALAQYLRARPLDLWTVSTKDPRARLCARNLRYVDGSLAFDLVEGHRVATVRTSLIGDYNVSNLLGVLGGLRSLGVPLAAAASACSDLTSVPGRMQRVPASMNAPDVVVDYAHTPDALEKALQALQPFAQARGGELWCVFGCGGNRDASKRPLMGAIAQRLAAHVVVTSDNPRLEDPQKILEHIVAGMDDETEPVVIGDRHEAIDHAVRMASPRDVVLVAGKGHETYQDIGGIKRPFSDLIEAGAALSARGAFA